jgi:DNA-binding NarL/FixJ family response regulator
MKAGAYAEKREMEKTPCRKRSLSIQTSFCSMSQCQISMASMPPKIIKKYLPSATIYFVTQYDSLEVARATAEVGASGYIAKVHIPTDLVPAIEAAVDFPPAEVKP